jgi:DNA-damage-inducible protein J
MCMNTSVINIKTDPKVKKEAQRIASDLGFSLSSLINGYLRNLIKTKTISYSLRDEEPSEMLVNSIKEAEKEREAGDYYSFTKADEALEFIDKLIDENSKN